MQWDHHHAVVTSHVASRTSLSRLCALSFFVHSMLAWGFYGDVWVRLIPGPTGYRNSPCEKPANFLQCPAAAMRARELEAYLKMTKVSIRDVID